MGVGTQGYSHDRWDGRNMKSDVCRRCQRVARQGWCAWGRGVRGTGSPFWCPRWPPHGTRNEHPIIDRYKFVTVTASGVVLSRESVTAAALQ